MGRAADRRRERLRKDTRLNWRDPNMPVIREYVVHDEYDHVIGKGVELVSPEEVTTEAKASLRIKDPECPKFRNDPSYNWALQAKYVKENPNWQDDDGEEDQEAQAEKARIESKLYSAQRRRLG